jgi:uncharacterized protein (UPF0333 family)
MKNRAQLSLELIIIIAAIIAIALIMFKALSGNASNASERLGKDTDSVLDDIEKLIK